MSPASYTSVRKAEDLMSDEGCTNQVRGVASGSKVLGSQSLELLLHM